MADRTAFSDDEWTSMVRAPFLAGLLVASASPSGMLGSIKEAFAAKKLLTETRENAGQNALVDLVVADLETDDGRSRADLLHLANLGSADATRSAYQTLKSASQAAYQHAPGEANGYAQWLLELGKVVASASVDGGFLGVGGKQINEAEDGALERLREALDPTESLP